MTDSIDKRIVEMGFENDKFEKNVSTSLSTLDKLKRALNFGDAGKSFDGLTASAKRVNLGSIAAGVENISSKFSLMGIAAIATLASIVSAAVNAGIGIVKALTIDPIKAGLQEYEVKLNSVQTILANTQKEGTNLKTVTDALNLLNDYSDKTIYNFQQMTKNVGTFTAAGVSLGDSVQAIKGIANLAALSGSNADQASTAMYQLSQALSSGTVKLMDWNSVVNAGMGGQVFQDAIKETARVHGVAIDDMIKQDGSFRETLQRGWFTSEILTETLSKFTGDLNAEQLKTMGYTDDQIASIVKMGQTATDAATKVKTFSQLFNTLQEAAQSGWAQTWEIIIGDFNEAKSFLTDLNNWFGSVIAASAKSRNDILQGWKDLGGRTAILESFKNVINAVVSLINPIKEAFREFFPPATAQQLFTLSMNIRAFTQNLILGGETAEKIKKIFRGVFAIFDIGKQAVLAIAKEFGRLFNIIKPAGGGLLDFVVNLADYIVKVRDAIKESNFFGNVMKTIGDFILLVAGVIGKAALIVSNAIKKFKELNKTEGFFKALSGSISIFFESFKNLDFGVLKDFVERLKARFKPIGQIAEFIKKAFGSVSEATSPIREKINQIGEKIRDALGNFLDVIKDKFSKFDFSKFSFKGVFDGLNSGLLAALLLAITKFVSKGTGIFGSITDIFKEVSGFATNANAILSGITTVLTGVKDIFTAWQQQIRANILLKIAGAIGILALSLIAISLIDSSKLTISLAAITGLFANLLGALATYEKVAGNGKSGALAMAKGVGAMIGLSTALLILSGALSVIAKIPTDDILKAIGAIAALTAILVTTSKLMSNNEGNILKGSLSMIVFSVALRTLIGPIKTLGSLDMGQLAKGITALGIVMLELGAFMKTMNFDTSAIDDMIAIFILGASISDLANTISQFASMDSKGLAQGLSVLALILAELGVFAKVAANGQNFVLTATGMLILSGAMLIMAQVLDRLGGMSWEELAVGLTGLGGALLILGVALTAMTGTLTGSAALLVAAGALAILVPALKLLGSMSLEQVGIGLLALAGVLTIFGVAGAILTPVIPTLLGLALAIGAIGVAVLAAGVGIGAFAAGLALLATVGAGAGAALSAVLLSIATILPLLAVAAGLAIIAFAKTIKEGAPVIFEAGKALLLGFIKSVTETMPEIIGLILAGIDTLLQKLAEKIPSISKSGAEILFGLLLGLRSNIPAIVIIATDIISSFINALAMNLPKMVDAGWNFIITWIDTLAAATEENIPRLMESLRGLGTAIVKGVLIGLLDGQIEAVEGIIKLGKALVEGFKNFFGISSPSTLMMDLAIFVVQGFAQGIQNGRELVTSAAIDLANKVIDAVKGTYDNMLSAGQDLVKGFAAGITGYVQTAIDAAKDLAQSVLNTVSTVLDSHSPSRKLFEQGKNADTGLAGGILQFSNVVVNSVKKVGNDTISAFSEVVSQIADSVNINMDVAPTIRPVVDLTEIEKGGSRIKDLFGTSPVSLNLAGKVSASLANKSKDINPTEVDKDAVKTGTEISFTQINNSPKALSRAEIYRQTKNQISFAKKRVGVL
jgi:tape measure domain-containing protein